MIHAAELYLLETKKSFRGLKSNTEKAIAQLSDEELHRVPDPSSNSIAILMQHMAGNMISRFTDFLTSDGEKANRNRDAEFVDNHASREALFKKWEEGWKILAQVLDDLTPEDLEKTVMIRNEPHTVVRALHRQLVHYAYHSGQIVYICKYIRSGSFTSLTIPKQPANQR
jgi:hypothetical protein